MLVYQRVNTNKKRCVVLCIIKNHAENREHKDRTTDQWSFSRNYYLIPGINMIQSQLPRSWGWVENTNQLSKKRLVISSKFHLSRRILRFLSLFKSKYPEFIVLSPEMCYFPMIKVVQPIFGAFGI